MTTSKARKICVVNYKGGTGKTCTVVNLAHGLARSGKKVLIVDTDPQGSSGYHLNVETQHTLYDLLIGGAAYGDCIQQARPNLDIITSNERLFPAEMAMASMKGREKILKKKLIGLEAYYDFILLDCSPSINLINQNALLFSKEIFLPVSMEYLSLVGIKQLLNNVKIVNRMFNHSLTVTKLIPTFFDKRNNKSKIVLESLERVFSHVMASPIRLSISISEAAGFKQTIFEYNPNSLGAQDYQRLTEEVISNG